MLWCPNCKSEYRDGFLKCSDCGALLVDELPEKDKDNKININESISPCFLISVSNEIQAKFIESVLNEADIPFFTKDRECGAYLKVYMGFSVFGMDIYVAESNYIRAKELVHDDLFEPEVDNDFEPLKDNDNRSFFARRTVMRLFIYVIVLFFAFGLIIGIVNYISKLFYAYWYVNTDVWFT